jgi:adenosylhomocysteine nucleosidase
LIDPHPIAIVGAMHEELHALLPHVDGAQRQVLASRTFHVGRLHEQPVVLALSGIGKVAAAATAALLVDRFDAAALLFTGVAGGLHADVAVGDVVVARSLLQHDMDASPLFPRYEVPLTGRSRFAADAALADTLADAARRCLEREAGAHAALPWWPTHRPARVHEGLIVSGDRFVSSAAESARLRNELPDALAVEMEGAAVAQVCADFGRPFAVLRSISDRADDAAHVDFARFVAEVASVYTRGIVADWLARRIAGR